MRVVWNPSEVWSTCGFPIGICRGMAARPSIQPAASAAPDCCECVVTIAQHQRHCERSRTVGVNQPNEDRCRVGRSRPDCERRRRGRIIQRRNGRRNSPREAISWESAPRFVHRDRDSIYGNAVTTTINALGITGLPSAPRSPWQNPYCERVTVRRDLRNSSRRSKHSVHANLYVHSMTRYLSKCSSNT